MRPLSGLCAVLLCLHVHAAHGMYEDWGTAQSGFGKRAEEGKVQKGGWRCGVCGEVVAAYRDSAVCNGDSPTGGVLCGLSSQCDQFDTPARRASCQDLRRGFRESQSSLRAIVKGMEAGDAPYEICVQLGKCQVQTGSEGSSCFAALNTDRCQTDPICPAGTEICDNTCLSCTWLVRTWPLFQGRCKSAVLGSAPTAASAATKSKNMLRRRLLTTPRVRVGLGSPPNDPDPITPRSDAELADYCYETWDSLEKDPNARYVSISTDQLGPYPWTADLACKCLRQCPFDEFEALKVMSACDFVDQTSDLTSAVDPDIHYGKSSMHDGSAADYFQGSSLVQSKRL